MPDTTWAFRNLLNTCKQLPNALPPDKLHGFLTGIAIGPEDISPQAIVSTAYGFTLADRIENYPELEALLWDATDEIVENLITFQYVAMLSQNEDGETQATHWLEGFNKAVALHEKGWESLNEEYPEAVKQYRFIQSLANPAAAEDTMGIPVEDFKNYLAEALPLLDATLSSVYLNYWGDPDMHLRTSLADIPIEPTLDDLPHFSSEELQQQSDEELLFTILNHGDMLPREALDEAIRRGETMTPLLCQHLEDDDNWREDVDADDWWGLLHAAFILGHIHNEGATQGLFHLLYRMDKDRYNDLWDWLGTYWTALFQNKRDLASAGLQSIMDNRDFDWYPRSTALQCLLEAAHASGPFELDAMLQRIAQICADETEDWEYRLIASNELLNFPRESFRPLLERLASEQEQREEFPHYDKNYVEKRYASGEDRPEWERFGDPLAFYEPENILKRLIRWEKEDREEMAEHNHFDDIYEPPYPYDLPPVTPFVRESPKVGRNDPCPCGSGKKYKKCCLKKLH